LKILVFGSREWVWDGVVYRILSKLPKDTILVHGAAHGADRIAGKIGHQLGFDVRPYPVTDQEWKEHGPVAGNLRNARMLASEHPDADGVKIDKAFGFATGPVTMKPKKQNRGTFDMSQKLWTASIRFEILFPPV
jgi:hypothetical protein